MLEIFYQFALNKKDNNKQQKSQKNQNDNKIVSFFDDEKQDIQDNDIRSKFSKEIINSILNDLNVKKINKTDLDTMHQKIHDILNRYQNIAYSQGYHAAKNY